MIINVAMTLALAVSAMNQSTSRNASTTRAPAVAGSRCLGSWTSLQGNLPLGSTDRSTEVIRIWKLFLPVNSTSRIFAGWVYENRNHDQFVQVKTDANADTLESYVTSLPNNAQIRTKGLRPFAYDPIGQAGHNQQFVATLASRHMVEDCFSGNLQ
jgi:hypothetical protein